MTVIEDNIKMAADAEKSKLAIRVKMLLTQGEVLIEDTNELDVAVKECIAALDDKGDELSVTDLIAELERKYDEEAISESTGIYKCVLDYETRLGMLLDLLEELEGSNLIEGEPLLQPPSSLPDQKEKSTLILKQYKVPSRIYQSMNRYGIHRNLKLSPNFTRFNYIEQFQKYLWVEEAYRDIEMQQYSMTDVYLQRHRNYFLLKVPGLDQGRPSLMTNDTLLLKKNDSSKTIFQGYIHQVRADDVLLKFNRNLHRKSINVLDESPYNVTFRPSRASYKWLHHGIMQWSELRQDELFEIVFPKVGKKLSQDYVASEIKDGVAVGQLCQVRKGLNKNQLRAVLNVLNARNRPSAYLIHGCPGGGKSRVVVEIVHQVYCRKPNFKILVCGNSNSCADLLAERLLEPKNLVSTNHIVRIASYNRLEQPSSSKLDPILKSSDEFNFDAINNFRIFVTTCIKAGSLNRFPGLKFDYVIVDEAGHASEPETLIPVGLLKKDGCLVLVGDWLQLGPFCLSAIARKNILGTSLLERLANMPMYKRQSSLKDAPYNPTYITKLNESYRSDPRVLAVNNDLFYESALVCKAISPPSLLKHMNVTNPLVFIPIEGREQRKKHSPSWHNPLELFACIRLVQRLYKYKTKSSSFSASNVGIVTPYTLQIQHFNYWFEKFGISKCKIGTVETYQGDERDVIIISTVRTTDKIASQKISKFQFLFQPKRFNVATSRAKYLTILVGDPETLKQDRNWSEFISRAEIIKQDRYRSKRKS